MGVECARRNKCANAVHGVLRLMYSFVFILSRTTTTYPRNHATTRSKRSLERAEMLLRLS